MGSVKEPDWVYCKVPRDMSMREFLATRDRYLPADWALPRVKAPEPPKAPARPKFVRKQK